MTNKTVGIINALTAAYLILAPPYEVKWFVLGAFNAVLSAIFFYLHSKGQ